MVSPALLAPVAHTQTHTPTKPQRSIYADQTTDMWTFFKNRQIFYVVSFRCVNTGPNYTSCLNHFPTFHSKHEYNFNETCTMRFIFKTASRVTEMFWKTSLSLGCLYKLFVFLAGLALKIERWASLEGRLSLNILIFYRQSQERGIL